MLYQPPGQNKVYYVDASRGTARWVADEASAARHFGANWGSSVRWNTPLPSNVRVMAPLFATHASVGAGINSDDARVQGLSLVPQSASMSLLGDIGRAAGPGIIDWAKEKLGIGKPDLPALPGTTGQPLPGLPPAAYPGGFGIPPAPTTPVPGIGGAIQRWLPGGKSGYLFEAMQNGFAPIVQPATRQRMVCPPGYVLVNLPEGPACMMKPLATRFGLWKARPKPPVSGWDMRAIRRASSAEKRVKNLASKVGLTTRKRGTSTRSTRSTSRKKC